MRGFSGKTFYATTPVLRETHWGNRIIMWAIASVIIFFVARGVWLWWSAEPAPVVAPVAVPVASTPQPIPIPTPLGVQPCTQVTAECGEHKTSATGDGKPLLSNGARFAQGTDVECFYAQKYGVPCADVKSLGRAYFEINHSEVLDNDNS